MGRIIPYIYIYVYYGIYKMFQTTNQIKDESINDMNMEMCHCGSKKIQQFEA